MPISVIISSLTVLISFMWTRGARVDPTISRRARDALRTSDVWLRVGEQVLLELIFTVESFTAQRAAVRTTVNHAVLDQVWPRSEPIASSYIHIRAETKPDWNVFVWWHITDRQREPVFNSKFYDVPNPIALQGGP